MPNLPHSFDDDLLKRARKIAIEKDTSLAGLIRVCQNDATELERLFSESTEDLHER